MLTSARTAPLNVTRTSTGCVRTLKGRTTVPARRDGSGTSSAFTAGSAQVSFLDPVNTEPCTTAGLMLG